MMPNGEGVKWRTSVQRTALMLGGRALKVWTRTGGEEDAQLPLAVHTAPIRSRPASPRIPPPPPMPPPNARDFGHSSSVDLGLNYVSHPVSSLRLSSEYVSPLSHHVCLRTQGVPYSYMNTKIIRI